MPDSRDFAIPGEGSGRDRRDLLDEALPLMAEDLHAARLGLRIASATAAERCGLGLAVYRVLEEGRIGSDPENLGIMLSASRCLGLEQVRWSYVGELGQYIKMGLSADGPLEIFVDSLEIGVGEVKEQSLFFSPHRVLALVEDLGFNRTFDSRKLVDKQLIELWVSAILTQCLDCSQDYYVRLARRDPPDAEVLRVNGVEGNMGEMMLEITQHSRYSQGLFDVIGKKLRKRYEAGTVLVVLVEVAEEIPLVDLDEFIRVNNPHNQSVVIIGGGGTPGVYKIVPLNEVDTSVPGETGWMEIRADGKSAGKGYRSYEGVVLKPPSREFLPYYPVFVKELNIRCDA